MSSDKTRKQPGWEDAPVPVCMGGDARALAFCCKEVHAMPPGFRCTRDEMLAETGLEPEAFVRLKEEFSAENTPDWEADEVCYGSLSYCCMRSNGCPGRDGALRRIYPDLAWGEVLEKYFSRKKRLAELILAAAAGRGRIKCR